MNRWRVGEDRGSKETDGCPLTGGKTKNKKQEAIKKGPIEVSIEIRWSLFLDEVAELVQMTAVNLITDTFEWRWLKPANRAWLPSVSVDSTP
jgi:hypothetical protein